VLLGDPNQLPQVSQGTHPEGAAASALEHLVGDAKTIPPDRGLLLGTTYRLHPAVNAFISDAFYEGRLATAPANDLQRVEDGDPVGGTGIRHVSVRTVGASNRSREEAAWIAEAVHALRGRRWINERGEERPLEVDDVIIVAPYNAQVAEIGRAVKERVGSEANVGTVDRFQGREGAVAIYSMTTSTPEDAPRDIEFLYSGNRLNVAVSRARALAVVVANPELFRVACHTPEQMRLLNAFCRLLEVAAEQRPGLPVAVVPAGGPAEDADAPLLLFPELGPHERRRAGIPG
jgi:superfamily I DNA and/or RNA helicase